MKNNDFNTIMVTLSLILAYVSENSVVAALWTLSAMAYLIMSISSYIADYRREKRAKANIDKLLKDLEKNCKCPVCSKKRADKEKTNKTETSQDEN